MFVNVFEKVFMNVVVFMLAFVNVFVNVFVDVAVFFLVFVHVLVNVSMLGFVTVAGNVRGCVHARVRDRGCERSWPCSCARHCRCC